MGASSLNLVLNYDNAANFTFDSDLIEFVGGAAALKLQEAQEVFAQNFNSDSGFTYNAALAEFTGGQVQQIDQTPTDSLIAATYTSVVNASWSKSSISLTAALVGTPTIVSNRLQCFGVHGVRYEGAAIGAVAAGAIKFKYRPNYTTSPATNLNMVALNPTSGNNDRLLLTHSPSGDTLRITLANNIGTSIYNAVAIGAAWQPTAGTTYEFELNFSAALGVIRVFIDGVLHGTLTPGAWTRGTSATRIAVGANPQVYTIANAEFEDVVLFSTVQHTSGYTPGYSLTETIYLESKIDLPVFTFSGVGSIVGVDSATVSETDEPHYIVAGRYWNGTTWAVSDGSYAQSANSADTIANLPSFPATGATLVPVSVVFGDSNIQQAIDDFSVTVTGTVDYPLTNPAILSNASVQADALEDFEQTAATITGSDDIKYILRLNGQDKYWDGAAWVNSDSTYAQSNTPAEISDNAAALDISTGVSIQVKVLLHSDDGLTTPSIETVTLGYNFFNTQGNPPTCTVWGFVRDISGIGIEGVTVTFMLQRALKQYREAGDSIIDKTLTRTTDANGRFEIDLIRTSSFENAESGRYVVVLTKTDEVDTEYLNENQDPIEFVVPDASDVNITDQITEAA